MSNDMLPNDLLPHDMLPNDMLQGPLPAQDSEACEPGGPAPETQTNGKREQTKSQNRGAILAAAREVFAELGYEAASVRDIIRRTGLASGTFYNYYRSKEEVAKAIATDAALRLRPILRAHREQAADFESYLNGIVRAYFQFIIDDQRPWRPGRAGPAARPLAPRRHRLSRRRHHRRRPRDRREDAGTRSHRPRGRRRLRREPDRQRPPRRAATGAGLTGQAVPAPPPQDGETISAPRTARRAEICLERHRERA